ncbi:MAG: MATE family efflux transporter [Bacteroidales bacterium]|nr:MATE family efflux transporter [Bacteroidales bacterium]
MAYDNRDCIDFENGNVHQLFRSLFIPTLLGMLFNIAFTLTDGIFVGHGIGAVGLASINLIAPVMLLVNGMGAMLGIGVSVVASIHLSRKNNKAARINVTQAFGTAIITGTLLGALLYAMPNTVMHLLGVSDTLHDATREYYLWFIPTCLLMLVETMGMYVIRLDGSPRYAMLSNMIPALTNILLDYVFIFPCHWGLMGAALATDIGGMVGVLMVAYYMLFKTETLHPYRLKLTATSLRLSLRNVGYMVRVGFAGLLGELAISVMMLTGNWMFATMLGDNGVAAYSVVCYLFPLVYMVYLAISQSAQPIISYNYGIRKKQRVKAIVRFSMIMASVCGLAVGLVMTLASKVVASAFLDPTAAAFPLASHGVALFAFSFFLSGINICAISYFQSVEQSRVATLLMTIRGIVLPVVNFLLLPLLLGTDGLWLAIPLAELITTLTLPLLYRTHRWSDNPNIKSVQP